jgi:WD40 repeat protein
VGFDANAVVVLVRAPSFTERCRFAGFAPSSNSTTVQDPAIAFSPDGRTLAIGVNDVTLVNVESGRKIAALPFNGLKEGITAVQFSPDGRRLVAANRSGEMALCDVESGKPSAVITTTKDHAVTSLSFSGGGERLLVGVKGSRDSDSRMGTVQLVDPDSGVLKKTLKGHTKPIFALAFSDDGKQIATAGSDRSVRVWESESGREVVQLPEQPSTVFALAFTPDGAHLATGSNGIELWGIARPGDRKTFPVTTGLVYCLAISPDGRILAAGGGDGHVRIWELATQTETWTSRDLGWPIRALAFSPDGARISVAGGDVQRGTAVLFHVASGEEDFTLDGHTGAITAIQFSGDGREILTAGIDAAVRIWDAQTGALRITESKVDSPVSSLAIRPGGRMLVTGTLGGYTFFHR